MKVLIFALIVVVATAQMTKVIPEIEQDGAALKAILVDDFKQLIAAKKQFKADLVKLMVFEQSLKKQAEDFLPKTVDGKVPLDLQSLYMININWGKVADAAGHVGEALAEACEDVCDDLADAAADAGR